MCPSTTYQDEKKNSANDALHVPNIVITTDDEGDFEPDRLNSSLLLNGDTATSDAESISYRKTSLLDSDNDVEVKSTNFCAEMIMLPVGVCQGSTDFAEHMDIFMRCQHPLDILSIFHEDEAEAGGKGNINNRSLTGDADVDAQSHRVSGYHAIPRSCEYCGSRNIDLCRNDKKCEMPTTYFPREIPPFYSKGGQTWKEDKNLGVPSHRGEDDAIIESDEIEKKDVTTTACAAWI